MKPQEIRDLNPEEIERKLKELKDSFFKLKMKFRTKQVENTAQIRDMKKDLARMLTVLKQKKAGKEAKNAGKK